MNLDENNQGVIQQTVVDQVMNLIKQSIASGQYRPGDRLPSETDLAQKYRVGRSSIREALKVFQHLGVVESRSSRGTVVCDRANISAEAITWAVLLGNDDLADVLDLREIIERACVARLTAAVKQGDRSALEAMEALEQVVKDMTAAAEISDLHAVVDADYRFHGLIIAAGSNELFRAIYSSLRSFMRAEILTALEALGDLKSTALDHADILRILRSETTEQSLRRHQEHFELIRKLVHIDEEPQSGTGRGRQ